MTTPVKPLSVVDIVDLASPILGGTITLVLNSIQAAQASEAERREALTRLSGEITLHIAKHLALVPLDTKDPANLPPKP